MLSYFICAEIECGLRLYKTSNFLQVFQAEFSFTQIQKPPVNQSVHFTLSNQTEAEPSSVLMLIFRSGLRITKLEGSLTNYHCALI